MRSPFFAARLAVLLFALALGLPILAAEPAPAPKHHAASGYYVGTIGRDLHVQVDLAVDGMGVSGTYYYERFGEPLTLKGLVDAHQKLQLEELDAQQRKTGTLGGKFAADPPTFEGDWSSLDGKKTLPVHLTRVAEYATLKESPKFIANYPVFFSPPAAMQEVSQHVHKIVAAAYKEFARDAKTADMPAEKKAMFELQDDCRVQYCSDNLISTLGTRFSYTGGVHPNTNHYSLNYRIKDDKAAPVRLADLFLPGAAWEKHLSDLIMADLRHKKAGWVLEGQIKALTPKDLAVFTLTPRGITFVFSPVAVSCYADGTFIVVVPFKKLDGLIDPAGPLKPLVAAPGAKP